MNKEGLKSRFKNFYEKIKSGKAPKIAVAVILLILVLCLFMYKSPSVRKTDDTAAISEYTETLENRLENILSAITGAGRVKTMITLESGSETVIAMKRTTSVVDGKTLTEETPILVNGKTVTLKELYPKISGVLIVCEGANSISVKTKLLTATEALLKIDKDRIEILTMK